MDMVYNWFFLLDWCGFLIKWIWLLKLDLVIKIGFGSVSTLVMVNLIFCTPLGGTLLLGGIL
jgi:hypothetical protein